MAQMLVRQHIAIVLIHPLGSLQVCDVLLHVSHDLVDVLSLAEGRNNLFLVEMVLYVTTHLLGPNLLSISFFVLSSSPSPLLKCT